MARCLAPKSEKQIYKEAAGPENQEDQWSSARVQRERLRQVELLL